MRNAMRTPVRVTALAVAGALAASLAVCPARVAAQATAEPSTLPRADAAPLTALTLPEALLRAEQANPQLAARRAQISTAQGARDEAGALLYNNPTLSLEQRRRSVPQAGLPDERRREWAAGLSQSFELAGQRGYRRDAAQAALDAQRLEIDDAVRQVRAEAAQQFTRVLALQERVTLEAQSYDLLARAAAAVAKRRAAGEDTKLDANVAQVEAERAKNQLAASEEQLLAARSDLAALLQLPPPALPLAQGRLDAALAALPAREALQDGLQALPRLQALAAREAAARARLELERASRYPDVTVSVNVGREGALDARERLTTVGVSLPLPLFRHNAAGIGAATTELEQARVAQAAAQRDAQAQVQALWWKQQSLNQRVQRLQGTVLPALDDNARLAQKSQQAGQINVLELIVVNRQTLDARRELIDALTEARLNRIALDLAAGRAVATP